ncbi:MAG TPA: glycogen debranching N-terminal domain-containing protein, partial [Myxococcota bacterium]|nr:glycogen debranching N-terminal domain-containing protein [Myxococcota bacterium]
MSSEHPYAILAEDGAADERALVLARGDSFALFDHHGDLRPQSSGRHGLFYDGTRFLSLLVVRLARRRPLLLSSGSRGSEGLSIHATNADVRDGDLVRLPRETVYLHRAIELQDGGLRLVLSLRSFAAAPVQLDLDFAFGADFADVFEVRGARRQRRGDLSQPQVERDAVELRYTGLDRVDRSTRLQFSEPPAAIGHDFAHYQLVLEPGGRKPLTVAVQCEIHVGELRRFGSFARPRAPRREVPPSMFIESSNPAFDGWVRRSASDLAMMTAETTHGPYPYAGVPWFSTPFGRDAIVTAFSVLWLDPGLARGVLRFLAATQCERSDSHGDAEPGKIVHEMRGGEMAALDEVPFGRYYGSVDATPWFLMLAAAYHDRTGDDDLLRELWPSFHRALAWIDGPGDPDGDGFVEYQQRSPAGLSNQGWKDSHDSIMHADGSLAE